MKTIEATRDVLHSIKESARSKRYVFLLFGVLHPSQEAGQSNFSQTVHQIEYTDQDNTHNTKHKATTVDLKSILESDNQKIIKIDNVERETDTNDSSKQESRHNIESNLNQDVDLTRRLTTETSDDVSENFESFDQDTLSDLFHTAAESISEQEIEKIIESLLHQDLEALYSISLPPELEEIANNKGIARYAELVLEKELERVLHESDLSKQDIEVVKAGILDGMLDLSPMRLIQLILTIILSFRVFSRISHKNTSDGQKIVLGWVRAGGIAVGIGAALLVRFISYYITDSEQVNQILSKGYTGRKELKDIEIVGKGFEYLGSRTDNIIDEREDLYHIKRIILGTILIIPVALTTKYGKIKTVLLAFLISHLGLTAVESIPGLLESQPHVTQTIIDREGKRERTKEYSGGLAESKIIERERRREKEVGVGKDSGSSETRSGTQHGSGEEEKIRDEIHHGMSDERKQRLKFGGTLALIFGFYLASRRLVNNHEKGKIEEDSSAEES